MDHFESPSSLKKNRWKIICIHAHLVAGEMGFLMLKTRVLFRTTLFFVMFFIRTQVKDQQQTVWRTDSVTITSELLFRNAWPFEIQEPRNSKASLLKRKTIASSVSVYIYDRLIGRKWSRLSLLSYDCILFKLWSHLLSTRLLCLFRNNDAIVIYRTN